MNNIADAIAAYRYAFAFWTDSADFIIDKNADLHMEKLLEIRCFDETGEFRAARSTTDEDFSCREIRASEEAGYADGYFDEAQYLDIDAKRAAEGCVYATGGGKYRLPEDAAEKKMVLVRYYYRYDEEGVARRTDWRLTGFVNEETHTGGAVNGDSDTK